MKKTLATRSIGRGLAKIEPESPNTLIAYSAKAGSTAQDGAGKDSPFTTALANHLTTPGLDIRRAFGFVRDDVLKTTSKRQEPYVYGSLGGDDVALVPNRSVAPPPAPAPNPQADIRRDYELALQVGNKAAFDAFLAQHPDGFYASLAKLQLDKIAADQAHVAAVEKSRQAEQERERLAAEGAKKDAQAKADADAKAAEQARIDAERIQQVAQQQAADAERKRVEAAPATPPAPTPTPAAPDKNVTVASLNPAPSQTEITKSVQSELRRVGCYSGNADGDWDSSSQRSLSQFNRNAGTKLDTKIVNADTLDTIKQKSSRVCPLVCEHGFKADRDHCTRIVCAEGSFINDDNECEKRRGKATVKREDGDRPGPRARDRQIGSARGRSGYDAGYGALPPRQRGGYYNTPPQGTRPLTGLEREVGCNTPGAIMSGKCP
jgi:Caspase domain/Putative peptidoglycan binding domain